MLDIRFIRENPEKVQQNAKERGYNVSIAELLAVDEHRRELQQQVDDLREQRNQNSAKMKGGKPSQELIDEGKLIVFAAQMHGNYVGRVGLCVSEADEEAFRQQLPSVPVVYSLEVLDGHKNQGIATQLMDIVESEVRRRGFDKIALGVVADNQIARTMYEARGYLYVRLGDSETIDSHWDVTGQDGGTEHVIVRLLPMVKSLSSR